MACGSPGTATRAFAEINTAPPDLVILDIWLKDSQLDGIDILKRVRRDNPAIPVVIISGHGNIEIAVAAIKQGAYDFIEKPFNIDQLMVVIGRALETSRLQARECRAAEPRGGRRAMIGSCAAFRDMKSQLDKVAREQQPGDADRSRRRRQGGGGALPAPHSDRAKGPFVTVTSASIGAGADGGGALRPLHPGARHRAGPLRAGPHRHPLLRRGRRHAAGHPVEDPAGAGRAGIPAGRGRGHGTRRRAGHLGHDPRPRPARCRPAGSAPSSTTA